MYAHYGRKACRLVYALFGAKSEARRLAIPAAGRSGCPGSVCILCRQQAAGAGLGMHIMTARRGMKKGAHIKYAPEKVCTSCFQRFKTRAASVLTSSSVSPV